MEGFGGKKAAYTDGNTHSVIRTDLNPRPKNAKSSNVDFKMAKVSVCVGGGAGITRKSRLRWAPLGSLTCPFCFYHPPSSS